MTPTITSVWLKGSINADVIVKRLASKKTKKGRTLISTACSV
jgi:hypothetical protein